MAEVISSGGLILKANQSNKQLCGTELSHGRYRQQIHLVSTKRQKTTWPLFCVKSKMPGTKCVSEQGLVSNAIDAPFSSSPGDEFAD
jgi:hypothetical protein